jgi:hypothetical protein
LSHLIEVRKEGRYYFYALRRGIIAMVLHSVSEELGVAEDEMPRAADGAGGRAAIAVLAPLAVCLSAAGNLAPPLPVLGAPSAARVMACPLIADPVRISVIRLLTRFGISATIHPSS